MCARARACVVVVCGWVGGVGGGGGGGLRAGWGRGFFASRRQAKQKRRLSSLPDMTGAADDCRAAEAKDTTLCDHRHGARVHILVGLSESCRW